jgi:hypothetical protein
MEDTQLLEFISESPFLSDNSKVTYTNALKKIAIMTNQSLYHVIHHPQSLDLSSLKSQHTQKTYLTAILALLRYSNIKANNKELFSQWYVIFKNVKFQVNKQLMSNTPSPQQKLAHVPWNDIINIRDALPYGSIPHLLLSLYTMIPPRRQLDYMHVVIYKDKSYKASNDHNYIHLAHPSGAYIQLSHYKTASVFKNWYKKLPLNLVKVIKASLKLFPRDVLFLDKANEPFRSVQQFTRWTNRILKKVLDNKKASVNTLRHSFENFLRDSDTPWAERKKIARDMGHSLDQAFQYQLQFDNKKNKKSFTVQPCFHKGKIVNCVITPVNE